MLANVVILPLTPAGTIAAFAVTVPVDAFTIEVGGCAWPDGNGHIGWRREVAAHRVPVVGEVPDPQRDLDEVAPRGAAVGRVGLFGYPQVARVRGDPDH